MAKNAFDADALITMFETASASGSAKLRQAVTDATLQALQGRELSLKNIRAVLGTVTQAANTGLAKNMAPPVDVDTMLDQAVAGMDDALLKAVDANQVALKLAPETVPPALSLSSTCAQAAAIWSPAPPALF